MKNQRTMTKHFKIKQILRCYCNGMGIKSISSSLLISRNTVKKYVRTYESLGIEIDRLFKMDESHLLELFLDDTSRKVKKKETEYLYIEEHLPYYLKRLKERGVTRLSLYEEYLKERPRGYSYVTFCSYIKQERGVRRPVARVEHIAGDKMYVDFAGNKPKITDKKTGEEKEVEVFAAVLPCSQYSYYEAVPSQKKEYLIQACENALHFFGGVPNAIVPDNLKSAVTKASGIEPVINEDFAAFAEHYNCVVCPARVRRPQDKALVEYAVRLLYREIYPKLNGRKFFDIDSLNIEIWNNLELLNGRLMNKRNYSRRERFLEVEKDKLNPLPETRYVQKLKKVLTVMKDSYVSLNNHRYSVPAAFIGKKVDVLYDSDTVEIFYNLKHITTHRRDDTPFTLSTKETHNLPGSLSCYIAKIEAIYAEAKAIDVIVEDYVKRVADAKRYPVQVVRSCAGIVSLAKKYGNDRLVLACQMAMETHSWGYNELRDILVHNEDLKYQIVNDGGSPRITPNHKNLRGKNYFNNLNNGKNDNK